MEITTFVGLAALAAAGLGLLLASRRDALVPSRGRDTIAMARTLWDLWKSPKLGLIERILIFGGLGISHTLLLGGIAWNWISGA